MWQLKNRNNSEVLRLAKALVSTPDKLCDEAICSKDSTGKVVNAEDPSAVSHCVGHAIDLATKQVDGILDTSEPHFYMFQFGFGGQLNFDLGAGSNLTPVGFSLTNHASVMQAFDLCIKAAEHDEGKT